MDTTKHSHSATFPSRYSYDNLASNQAGILISRPGHCNGWFLGSSYKFAALYQALFLSVSGLAGGPCPATALPPRRGTGSRQKMTTSWESVPYHELKRVCAQRGISGKGCSLVPSPAECSVVCGSKRRKAV